MLTSPLPRRDWSEVLNAARGIIVRYDTSVTFRQSGSTNHRRCLRTPSRVAKWDQRLERL